MFKRERKSREIYYSKVSKKADVVQNFFEPDED